MSKAMSVQEEQQLHKSLSSSSTTYNMQLIYKMLGQ